VLLVDQIVQGRRERHRLFAVGDTETRGNVGLWRQINLFIVLIYIITHPWLDRRNPRFCNRLIRRIEGSQVDLGMVIPLCLEYAYADIRPSKIYAIVNFQARLLWILIHLYGVFRDLEC